MVDGVAGLQFPPDFVWGAATASYQIEGATREDGRGESIWDRFCRQSGAVRNGDTGDVACDHYHRYREDVSLMRDLGLNAYRFSIAWPRILPDGMGRVNEAGLDFYDRLIDELLGAGIEPFCTLYHWDLPQSLEDRGGWPARDTAGAFEEYVGIVARRLGDRVRRWITHNEPRVVADSGYGTGRHAPGRKSQADALATAHHLLLSHGRAVEVIRREVPGAQVGITLNLSAVYPATDSANDAYAVREQDGKDNRWYLDPVFRGQYPEDIVQMVEEYMPPIEPGDLATIAAPIDFLGVNYYTRRLVCRDSESGKPRGLRPEGSTYTDMGWEVFPEGLEDLLRRVHHEYAPTSIYITENGAAFPDVQGHDGQVPDPERRAYIEQHLAACRRAMDAGVPLRGYFLWSLMDNFEWALGYSKRFGMVYVDYPSLTRTPKLSAGWYRDLILAQK